MQEVPGLADPTWEPSDEELAGLVRRAFLDTVPGRSAADEALRAEIARHRQRILALLAAHTAGE